MTNREIEEQIEIEQDEKFAGRVYFDGHPSAEEHSKWLHRCLDEILSARSAESQISLDLFSTREATQENLDFCQAQVEKYWNYICDALFPIKERR
jgi:hypothetical protein